MKKLPILIFLILSAVPGNPQAVAPVDVPYVSLPDTDDGLPGTGTIRRADWFQRTWTGRRNSWLKNTDRDQGALVFLGDSITQGWGDQMGNSFPGVKVANRGISGDTTRGMLLRLEDDVLALHPAAVVFLMGTNDLEENDSAESIAGNMKLIIAALKAQRSDLPIILCQVFPSSASKRRPAERIKEINARCFEVVKGDPNITVLDTWTLFANEQGEAKKEEFPDLLHPNKAGYDKWAAALRPVLATLGFMDKEVVPFTPEEGFELLYNGKDLSGWGTREKKTLAPQQSFDGQTVSPDGRYRALLDRLVVTTPPEGRRIQQLWTTREFAGNFTLKLEFRATPNADSGVFIRGPQLQCRDYPLAGPYKELKHYKAQDWNELVVVVKDGIAHCTCNGEVLEEALAVPASGPIGLEGDRGQLEYRHIRLRQD